MAKKFDPIKYCDEKNAAWAEQRCDRAMQKIENQGGLPLTPAERKRQRGEVMAELVASDPMNMVRHKLWDQYVAFWEHAKAELGGLTEEEAWLVISEDF